MGPSGPCLLTSDATGADTGVVIVTSRAWLYVRSNQTIRIVVDGASVIVHGPGDQFSHTRYREEMDAVLHHTAVEEALVRKGWSLECLTTERRAGRDRRSARRPGSDRRQALHLVKA